MVKNRTVEFFDGVPSVDKASLFFVETSCTDRPMGDIECGNLVVDAFERARDFFNAQSATRVICGEQEKNRAKLIKSKNKSKIERLQNLISWGVVYEFFEEEREEQDKFCI